MTIESIILIFIVPVAAMILDFLFGDPQRWPHPVRFIGFVLDAFEETIRGTGIKLRIAGWLALLVFAPLTWLFTSILISIPYVGLLIAFYLAYAGLAMGSLIKEARQVSALLNSGDEAGARRALSMLVSRDTSCLDPAGIRRTLAETVSENLNDGFVAPMFYLAIFGPAGLWTYKTVSTMDSMWGYRTERFRDLGYAAARADDVLAYIPARLTAWALLLTGRGIGLNFTEARANFKRDARKMESPNAGWPMAAAAWLLNGAMGGRAVYFGQIKEKPALGPEGREWDTDMVNSLIRLCKSSGYRLGGVLVLSLGWFQFAF